MKCCKCTIPLNKEAAKEASDQKKLSDREQAIYNLICENKHLTVEQVMAELNILVRRSRPSGVA